MENKGIIYSVSGPVVVATDVNGKMFDVVRVGNLGLVGEIIKIVDNKSTIQVYEDTSGLKPGEPVYSTGKPLSVELGPGLLKSIYDGIQRPLDVIKSETGDFIVRGASAPPLDENKEWDFKPILKEGDEVNQGYIIGEVQETELIVHKIMVPEGVKGIIKEIKEGKFKVSDTVCIIENEKNDYEIKLKQIWPVRKARRVFLKFAPEIPLITGQRVIDSFFPVAKGGTVAVPGPFGSGKTVIQHQLSKWSDADITVYVGCGERGNEMTEILTTFPELQDPKSGKPLMEKTILIANTSNMPVAAREASIYTGVTIAEYYRDMGYDVALMADSTSRWAEALREISGRLEEMPGEEGYPAYLGRRISEFYERSGNAQIIPEDDRVGSVTLIGAVSPPGGDLSDPVVQNTLRVTRVFWALDASLASRRHFPSINWLNSYSLYLDSLSGWFKNNVDPKWMEVHSLMMSTLQKEAELQEIVQLVGYDSLPEKQKNILDIARVIREDFLQQNAFDDIDTYCSIKKQYEMLMIIKTLNDYQEKAIDSGRKVSQTSALPVRAKISRMKEVKEEDFEKFYNDIIKEIADEYGTIIEGVQNV
ncbi:MULTISPECIES: V-type ATP synthase subunit A [unclassified Acidiplasma]|uniref:V-type ATP synthase subunit A n=1 Tax=unclassified Acidiplasma TaxID=2641301 RepID=UPI0005E2486E|nr:MULTISPECIES: V-type ATP synthase subunit A [unclassified Acidiplasma]KJE48963.1 ATP synthase subunit A [Acidiplasma sp. MBA-1]WMT54385.1 MAG: V-type ATP synthase subunit A [Acidiplasma sp.]